MAITFFCLWKNVALCGIISALEPRARNQRCTTPQLYPPSTWTKASTCYFMLLYPISENICARDVVFLSDRAMNVTSEPL